MPIPDSGHNHGYALSTIKGKVVAAGLVTEVCGIVQSFLAGSRNEFLRHSPAKVMENFVRYWAKARGSHWYHLGGGLGASSDSLFQFKLGFSPLTHPYRPRSRLRGATLPKRVIADAEAYLRLVRQWESLAVVPADGPWRLLSRLPQATANSIAKRLTTAPAARDVAPLKWWAISDQS